MSQTFGLLASNDVCVSGNPNSSYFIRRDEPVIIDTLIANEIITEEIDLDGGILTTGTGGTVLLLNGLPVGGGVVNTVTGTAPITVTGTATDPIVSLADSTVVPATYTVATVTVDSKGLITSASSGTIPPNDDWSNFPALTNVNVNNFLLNNVATPINPTDGATKGYVDGLDGQNVKLTGNQSIAGIKTFSSLPESVVVPTTNAQLVNKLYVDTLPAPPAETLSATLIAGNSAGANQINMNSNKIINCLDPTLAQDVATKNYVDTRPVETLSATLIAGNSAGANQINMNSNKIVNCLDPTVAQDVATKNYVDTRPVPTLGAVLTAGNTANQDINMNDFDISSVNDITMSGLLPTITATNVLGNLVISAAATMNLATIGQMTLASGGILSLGGATHTSIENIKIDNSVVTKDGAVADLSLNDIASVTNASAVLNLTGNTGVKPNAIVDRNNALGATGTILSSTGSEIEWIPRTTNETLTSAGTISNTTDISFLEGIGDYTLPNGLFNGQRKQLASTSLTPVSQKNLFATLVGSLDVTSRINAVAYDSVNEWVYLVGTFQMGPNGRRQLRFFVYDIVNDVFSDGVVTNGPNGTVDAVLLDGGVLYVGGSFSNAAGLVNTARFAIWTPTGFGTGSWSSPAGTQVPASGAVLAIVKYGTQIAIGGSFSGITGVANTSRLALYNPATSTFSAFGTGVSTAGAPSVEALYADGTRLYIGGNFGNLGGIGGTANIGYWDGSVFVRMGQGNEAARVLTIDKLGNDIIIGGQFDGGFRQTGFARVNANRIIRWNTVTEDYSTIGQGLGSDVNKVYVRPSTGELMAVGLFTQDGARRGGFLRVAIYDASNNIWNPFGGVDGQVRDLVELSDGSVLVVGGFANGMGAIGGFGYSCAQIIDPGFFMRVNGSFSGLNGTKSILQFTGAGADVSVFECVWSAINNRWMITNDANLPTR